MRLLLALLALTLLACGRPVALAPRAPVGCTGLGVLISDEFSQHERGLIRQAAAEWSAVGVSVEVLPHSWDHAMAYGGRLVVVKPATPFAVPAPILGRTARRERLTTIELVPFRLYSDAQFIGVAKHEFGHALGLGHTPEGLMRPTYAGNPTISASDVAAACP